ncbi:MAG: substrate-binding domain-containing protein [Boseongicola sp.]
MVARFILVLIALFWASSGAAQEMRLAVTTSFHNSGLSDVLLPQIKTDLGIDVQLLVVGTGQALRLGAGGDVDAILVHSKSAEQAFVEEGYATHRREIMYNDFVLVGPRNDPAGIGGADTAVGALQAIFAAKAAFVSRGDDSGTHRRELLLWSNAGRDPENFAPWYRSVGAGMGACLNTASGMGAYLISDRASWLNFANKGDLALLFAGDPLLFNQYSYLPINPEKHPHAKSDLAQKLEDWLTSGTAQVLIDGYEIDGEKLFVFNAING